LLSLRGLYAIERRQNGKAAADFIEVLKLLDLLLQMCLVRVSFRDGEEGQGIHRSAVFKRKALHLPFDTSDALHWRDCAIVRLVRAGDPLVIEMSVHWFPAVNHEKIPMMSLSYLEKELWNIEKILLSTGNFIFLTCRSFVRTLAREFSSGLSNALNRPQFPAK
jgi:hypothetical protein